MERILNRVAMHMQWQPRFKLWCFCYCKWMPLPKTFMLWLGPAYPEKKKNQRILSFGKGKKGFGKTVVLLLQLVMNWRDNQIIPRRASVGQIPLAYSKVREMWESEHLPSRNRQFALREKLVHVVLKVVTSKKALEVVELWINIFKGFGSVLECCYF